MKQIGFEQQKRKNYLVIIPDRIHFFCVLIFTCEIQWHDWSVPENHVPHDHAKLSLVASTTHTITLFYWNETKEYR